ncbi:uncharacterized membrane protein YhaH (DUF805 family) [Cricetibacter osteomyelitidis]|uniref:Uncharacterized membrane protein YhaH (DUF805 family) n=1 Tax=Cricetibacter osteomyelitidis TaxID=1521931 RepID=A0A4R2T8L1_9PAST|nr:DUF805 domain-containing protein [Cricetibacter osteomyelitidis]TCP97204.1 uncharacterized membrane protein YhaH (DUF805 family) [Cricetibacter osteomyelitidis]
MNGFIFAWQNAFNYKGRATREEFGGFVLISLFILLFIGWLEWVIFDLPFGEGYFNIFFNVISLCPLATLIIRRLHDLNKSAWWQMLLWGPLLFLTVLLSDVDFSKGILSASLGLFWFPLAIYCIVLIYCGIGILLKLGDEAANKYGERPEIPNINKAQFALSLYQQLKNETNALWLKAKQKFE